MNMSKKKTAIAACLVFLVLFSFAALPSIAYAADVETQRTRILRARGLAFEREEDGTANSPANMTLVLEPGTVARRVITFNVVSGKIEVDGIEYTVSEGKGFVAYHNRTIAMRFGATSPEGDAVTVKMAGRYFWMWGRLHVARLVGVLETDDCRMALLLRAAIRPEQ